MVDSPAKPKEGPLSHLPPPLVNRLRSAVPEDSVQAVACADLDEKGMYGEAWLVLTEDRLAHFRPAAGDWDGRWTPLAELAGAQIVEGLGIGVLQLTAGGRVKEEFRFSLRHAKDMARLQRRLERTLEGKDEGDLPPEAPRPDEKKVRCDKCGRVIPPWSEVCPGCLVRRKVLSRLMGFVAPYKWSAVAGFALGLLGLVSELVRPYLSKPMLDNGLGTGRGRQPDYGLVLIYVGIMAVLMVLSAVAGAVRERLLARLGSRVSRDIRDRTYEHLHRLSLSFFSRKPTGSLVTRITSDSDRIWDFVAFTVVEITLSFLTIAGVGAALFVLSWKLACIVLLPIPLMLFLTFWFHRRLHKGFDRLFHRWSRMTAIVADALPGVRVIKAFSQERHEVRRFGRENREYYDREVGMISLWTLFGPVMHFCSQVGAILVWVVGGWWAVQDWYHPHANPALDMTAGKLVAFAGYMWMFYRPIHMVAHMDRMFNRAAASVQRILEILDTEPAIFSRTGALPAKTVEGRVELRNVSFSYDGVRKVLKNVSLTVAPGEMVGLAGPSGGGKTTLVNLICRFYDVLEGRILIDGADVRDYDVEALRRRIGVVLQEPFLFHGTVARNIAYGHPEATLDEVIAAAKAANAHEFIVGFPDGYDTMVGERGHTLSGGERQRISIARAILCNPAILILDEATSSVDTETERLIQEALSRLVANRTTIAIAHRLSTLQKAHRLVILDQGEIVEQGTHEELARKEGGVYAKLVRMQTEMQAIMAVAG